MNKEEKIKVTFIMVVGSWKPVDWDRTTKSIVGDRRVVWGGIIPVASENLSDVLKYFKTNLSPKLNWWFSAKTEALWDADFSARNISSKLITDFCAESYKKTPKLSLRSL